MRKKKCLLPLGKKLEASFQLIWDVASEIDDVTEITADEYRDLVTKLIDIQHGVLCIEKVLRCCNLEIDA